MKARRVFNVTLQVILALITVFVLWSSYDAWLGKDSRDSWNTVLSDNAHGRWMTPEGDGPYPAIVLIHEWWGLNENMVAMSELLVKEGYAVLAVDAYRGRLATTIPGALQLFLTTDHINIRSDIDDAMTWLSKNPLVQQDRIGVIGFCFGGREALELGRRFPDIAAMVSLYGGDMTTDSRDMGFLGDNGPILAIYGEDDSRIPVELVKRFESAMNVAGIENTVSIYPGAGHAFVTPDTINASGAAQTAWTQIKDFFEENLQTVAAN